MSDVKISALPAAGTLDGTEVVPIVQSSATKKVTTAAIAALASGGAPGGPAGGDLTGTYPNPTIDVLKVTSGKIAALAVTTAKVADNAITNAKLDQAPANTIKSNLTGSTANETDNTLAAVAVALVPYSPESLAMMNESTVPADQNRTGILVEWTNNRQVSVHSAIGSNTTAIGYFDWTTFTWTETNVSVVTAKTYGTAIYVTAADRIWAADSGATEMHIINPSTGVGAVSATNLYKMVLASNGKVYGYQNGGTTLYECDNTGATLRTLNLGAGNSLSNIGAHPTSGKIYYYFVTGAGAHHVGEVDTTTFTAATWDISLGNLGLSWAQNSRIVVCPAGSVNGKLFIVSTGVNSGVIVTINGGSSTFVRWGGRFTGGGIAAVNPTTGYMYLSYLTNRFWIGKIDTSTAFFDSLASTPLASANSATTVSSLVYTADGHVVVQTNQGTYIRIYP